MFVVPATLISVFLVYAFLYNLMLNQSFKDS